LTCK